MVVDFPSQFSSIVVVVAVIGKRYTVIGATKNIGHSIPTNSVFICGVNKKRALQKTISTSVEDHESRITYVRTMI